MKTLLLKMFQSLKKVPSTLISSPLRFTKLPVSFFAIIFLFLSGNAVGQCTNCNSNFPSGTFSTTSSSWTNVATNVWGGEYAYYNVSLGSTYQWQTCGVASYNTQLTLRQGSSCSGTFIAYNDDFCSTQSQITWTATFTGTVTVLLSQYNCANNSTSTTVQWRCSNYVPPCSVSAASSSQSLCVNTTMANITHSTTGVTGITSSSGLPIGVNASYSSNTITISGIPSQTGTFNYTITPTGCATPATGTIVVYAKPTMGTLTVNGNSNPSDLVTVCPGQTLSVGQSGFNNQGGTTYFYSDNTTVFGGWAVVPEWEIMSYGSIPAANQVGGQNNVNNLSSFNYKINNPGTYILHANAVNGVCYGDGTNRYITVTTPSGDQASYGAGSWIGYVYESASVGSFSTYVGYVTESETFNTIHNTPTGATVVHCSQATDMFAIRYKMTKNFTSGYYSFTIGGDDGVRLSLDGGSTWHINSWIDQGYTTYSSASPVYLSGNVNLVFEFYENGGGAQSSFNYTAIQDGDCSSIYVDAVNGNDNNPGIQSFPVKTLSKALTLYNSTSRNHIKMTTGSYSESSIVSLQNNMIIEGRYTNTGGVWSKSSNTASSTSITCTGNESISGVCHTMGFKSDTKTNWKLIDLNITTGNASGVDASNRGCSNYGVWIKATSNYEISRCSITTGNASNGANGSIGANGANGANGSQGLTDNCNDDDFLAGGSGGAGGTNAWGGNGGNGGRGGNAAGQSRRSRGCNGSNGQTTNVAGGSGGTSPGTACQDNYASGNNNGDATNDNAVVGNPGNPSYVAGSRANANHSFAEYFTPSSQASQGGHGSGGGGGSGGGSSGGESCTLCNNNYGNSGGGGGGGGGGGQGGFGGYGGGSAFSIYATNSSTGSSITNNTLNAGSAGLGGNGGAGGSGGARGEAGNGNGSCSGDRRTSAAGAPGRGGGAGGRGQDAANGLSGQMVTDGVTSSPSATVPNGTIVTLNNLPNRICQNSVLEVQTSAASWSLPSGWEFTKYNNTSATSQYTAASTSAEISTSNTSGSYNLTANGVTFNSYLIVGSARTLPSITLSSTSICIGESVSLSASSWGTEVEYLWEIYSGTNADNKGVITNRIHSATSAITSYSFSTAGTYTIRYQVKESCCGWSIPVFASITVNPSLTASVSIAASPNTNICLGTTVTFTATPTNGGSTPSYQWKVNGTNVGTNSPTFTSATLTNGQAVTCEMTSNASPCLTGSPATSNAITISAPTAGTALSNNNESATCTVNQNGWIHFYHSSGRLIASINSQGQNLGNVVVTSYVDLVNAIVPACDDPSLETAVLQRHWVITPANQPTSNVLVRLPFRNAEYTTLGAAASGTANPADDVGGVPNFKLSRYHGPDNVNDNALDNCTSSGGSANTVIHSPADHGSTTVYSGVNGENYCDYSIPQFSEFWLHFQSDNSPLPVELIAFQGNCTDEGVHLTWQTASESNNDYFVVQRSRDGIDWNDLGTVAGNGNSMQVITYDFVDANGDGGYYYRLVQVDFNGDRHTKYPVFVDCASQSTTLGLYPNPTKDDFTLEVHAQQADDTVQISLVDVTGKLIGQRTVSVAVGVNTFHFADKLESGTYLVRVHMKTEVKSLKLVVRN